MNIHKTLIWLLICILYRNYVKCTDQTFSQTSTDHSSTNPEGGGSVVAGIDNEATKTAGEGNDSSGVTPGGSDADGTSGTTATSGEGAAEGTTVNDDDATKTTGEGNEASESGQPSTTPELQVVDGKTLVELDLRIKKNTDYYYYHYNKETDCDYYMCKEGYLFNAVKESIDLKCGETVNDDKPPIIDSENSEFSSRLSKTPSICSLASNCSEDSNASQDSISYDLTNFNYKDGVFTSLDHFPNISDLEYVWKSSIEISTTDSSENSNQTSNKLYSSYVVVRFDKKKEKIVTIHFTDDTFKKYHRTRRFGPWEEKVLILKQSLTTLDLRTCTLEEYKKDLFETLTIYDESGTEDSSEDESSSEDEEEEGDGKSGSITLNPAQDGSSATPVIKLYTGDINDPNNLTELDSSNYDKKEANNEVTYEFKEGVECTKVTLDGKLAWKYDPNENGGKYPVAVMFNKITKKITVYIQDASEAGENDGSKVNENEGNTPTKPATGGGGEGGVTQ